MALRAGTDPRATIAVFITTVGMSLLAFLAVYVSTIPGLGLREDSYTYVTAAESLAAGTGLGRWAADGSFRPLTHFPPLFPLILSVLKVVGLGLLPSVRVFNGILFGLTAALTALLARRLSASIGFCLLSGVIVLASPLLIEVYSWLQSEPLYLFLTLLTLLSLGACLNHPTDPRFLWSAGVSASLALLTRYAGISLVFLGIAVLAWGARNDRRAGSRRVLTFLGITLAPSIAVALANHLAYGGLLDRPVPAWHPPSLASLVAGSLSIVGWVLPDRIARSLPTSAAATLGPILLVALGIATLGLYVSLRREIEPWAVSARSWALVLLGHYISYLLVIATTVSFIDRLTPLNDRILSPLYLAGIPVISVWTTRLWAASKSPLRRTLLAVLIVAVCSLQIFRSARFVDDARQKGQGMSAREWTTSATIAYVRSLQDRPLYTNNLPALYFLAGKEATFIPSSWNAASAQSRADFPAALEAMRSDLLCHGGLVVILGSDPASRIPASDRTWVLDGLIVVAEFDDGLVYGAPQDSCRESTGDLPQVPSAGRGDVHQIPPSGQMMVEARVAAGVTPRRESASAGP
jgi:hypothetical protein